MWVLGYRRVMLLPEERGVSDEGRGIQIRVSDPAMQAYMQRYPFAEGPDETMNLRARDEAAKGMFFREAGPAVVPVQLSPEEAKLGAAEEQRAVAMLDAIGLSSELQAKHLDDFGWEANLVPCEARNVLVIGCGDAVEMVFLRAVAPEAQLTGVDYHDSVLPGLKDAVGMTLLTGDMHDRLRELRPEYDLVFSNHTLEHMYDPDKTLAMLAGLLVEGGSLISTFPMMAQEGTPFLEKVRSGVRRRGSMLPLMDMVYFDLGHPWKTNPADAQATLKRAGFAEVKLFQRRDHPCRTVSLSGAALEQERGAAVARNRRLLGPLVGIAARMMRPEVSLRVRKLILAVSRRVSFGTNRVMNEYSEEVLVLARKA